MALKVRRRALSSVYGFIIVFMLIMAGLEAFSVALGVQGSVAEAQSHAKQVESSRQLERLVTTLNGTSLMVANEGMIPSTLAYLFQSSANDSVDSRLGETVPVGASTLVPVMASMQRFAIVTSLGNVFVVSDGSQSQSGTLVTFDATGLTSSFGSSAILTVDGTGYNYSQLPRSFQWAQGSIHSYSYASSFPSGSGSRVGWSYTRGLTSERQGSLTVEGPGTVVSDYSLQYLLTASGGDGTKFVGSPAGDGWYDAGSSAQVSTGYVWGATANESRQSLTSYSIDGSTPVNVARAGGGTFTSGAITMDSPHGVQFGSATQYHLSLGSAWSLAPGASLTSNWAYTASTAVAQGLGNAGFESGTLASWSYNSNSGVVTSPVHSGSYSGFVNAQNDYGRDGLNCCTGSIWQDIAIPSGATLTSYSFTVWVYIPSTNTNVATVTLTGIECLGETGSSTSTTGSWLQLSYSWSGSCSGSSFLEYHITVFDHTSTDFVYLDDASASYSYLSSSSGSTASPVTASAKAGTVTYNFSLAYPFPQGAYGRSLTVTFPSTEAILRILIGGGPTALPAADYSLSGTTVSLPDSTIGTYGSRFTVQTGASGSYAAAQSGSQTGDSWYDSGTSATLTAAFASPFSFLSWAGSSTIASPTASSTTVLMDSYYALEGNFQVSQ